MQFFAAFLAGFFGKIFDFLASYFSKKVAIATAIGATILSITAAFYLSMKALIYGFTHTFVATESHWFLVGFYSVLPDNAVTCMSITFTAEILSYLYRYKIEVIKAISQSN